MTCPLTVVVQQLNCPQDAHSPPSTSDSYLLRSADFSRGSPPWHIARKCKLSDLELAGTPAAMAACGDRIVDVTLEADAAGRRSFFLR